jgi:DNA-binding NtrC family response regulator
MTTGLQEQELSAKHASILTGRQGTMWESKPEKQACVVLVDDDELVLSTLRMLLEINGGFLVRGFTDPLQAVQELEHTLVDVIISDYRMPGINGLEVLKKARTLQPNAMRIMLTGYADKQNASRAVKEAGIYKYMEKPWDNDHLLMVLRNALQEKGSGPVSRGRSTGRS